ncbi:MAG: Ni/Fe hydrogenase subunit alpha [Coriobacteriia bacterium]|nr:Ni/Fe hydrogenase subunit alpha [Coriobacteriia bacterium]
MPETVRLAPLKRLEGHGRVTLHLAEDGTVGSAHFDVTEFRGFERLVEGRMAWEMPLVTSRVCGICPVSHHVAAVKAVEAMLGVQPPRAGRLLRELLHLAGFVHDHALHFFFLAGPDFLTGDGAGSRDILGVVEGRPDLARAAIALRRTGQTIVETVGGQGHPVTAIPGGMSRGISDETRLELLGLVREAVPEAAAAERVARESTLRLLDEHPGFGSSATPYVGLLAEDGRLDLYDGALSVVLPSGALTSFPPSEYPEHIAERTLQHSFAKVPYLRAGGDRGVVYRVGPLARLNLAASTGGERADALLAECRETLGAPVHHTLAYHWARMIELVAVLERMEAVLGDAEVASPEVRVRVSRGGGSGVGVVEAPRGTLIHRYEADEVGRVTAAELIVATTHNNAAIDAAVAEAVGGADARSGLDDAARRRMELGIRAYDPCLSCATHEVGRMPLEVRVVSPEGWPPGTEGAA